MNMPILRSISRFLLLLLVTLAISCGGKRITKANVDEVSEGMSKKQVESILGPPTSMNNEDFVIMKKTTYVYRGFRYHEKDDLRLPARQRHGHDRL